jgi:hypothetical protein
MAARTTDFGSGSAASWPNLSNGDSWAAAVIPSSTVDVNSYSSLIENVSSAGIGQLYLTFNSGPSFTHIAQSGATNLTLASTTNASSYLVPSANIGLAVNTNYLLCFSTTAASSHTHVIDTAGSTGTWATSTYTAVVSNQWSIGGSADNSYCRQTIYHVKGPSSTGTVGRLNIQIKNAAGTSAVTATGRTFYVIQVTGAVDGSGAYINTASNSDTDGTYNTQPSVTLSSNLATRTSTVLAFLSHLTNDSSTSSSDSSIIHIGNGTLPASDGHGTPAVATAVMNSTGGTTSATRKTTKTVTGNFTTSTTAWGVVGCEVKDADTADDTWYNGSANYYTHKLANTTTYSSPLIYAGLGTAAPAYGVVGRYTTYQSNDYWISVSHDTAAGTAGNTLGLTIALNKLSSGTITSTTLTSPSVAVSAASFSNIALRIRELSSTSLWISAKAWNGTEPAWPTSSSTANSSSTTSGSEYVIGNGLFSSSTPAYADIANLIAGGSGKSGLFNGNNTSTIVTWSSFSDDVITESATGGTINGGGSLSSTSTRIINATSSINGGGTLSSTSRIVRTQSLSASISTNASIVKLSNTINASSISSSSNIIKSLNMLLSGSSSLNGSVIKLKTQNFISSITSSGADVILTTGKFLTSSISSSSNITKSATKDHNGLVESVAHIHRSINKSLNAQVSSIGISYLQINKRFTGSISSSGAFSYEYISGLITLLLAGSISSNSSIRKQVNKITLSSISSTSIISDFIARRLASQVATASTVRRLSTRKSSGSISSSGNIYLLNIFHKILTSTISTSSNLLKSPRRRISGLITSTSVARKQARRRLVAAISAAGSVIRLASGSDMAISGSIEIDTIIDINMVYEDASIQINIDGI